MKNNKHIIHFFLVIFIFLCLGAATAYKTIVSISTTTVDNAIVRWDSITGTRVQNSTGATIDDSGILSIVGILTGSLTVTNTFSADIFYSGVMVSSNIFTFTIPYGVDWSESTNVPTMGAIYDEIEASRLRIDGTLSVSNLVTSYDVIMNKTNGTVGFNLSTNTFRYFDELMSISSTTGDNGTAGITNGGGVVGVTNGEIKHPGLKFCRTTAADNISGWGWDGSPIVMTNTDTFYYIETFVKTPATLSGAGAGPDSYAIRFGFTSTPSSTNAPSDGSYLVYATNLLGSANWGFLTTSNSVSATIINTGVSVSASTYYKLGVCLTPTLTYGYINGNLVATNTTSIPLYRSLSAVISMHRYSGSTTVDMYIDYMFLKGVVSR